MLAESPGLAGHDAIERALAKIETAASELPGAPTPVRLPGYAERLETIRGAVERSRALRIRYYTATRDETTERVVDPIRVLMVSGRAYLEAWCRRAEAVRLFRADRVDAIEELDEPSRPPGQVSLHDVSDGIFQPGPELPLVTLRVSRGGRWITDYYPCEDVRPDGDEWLVSLRVTDLAWARRFVLGLGPDATVVTPPELVETVRAQAAAALDQYS
jgi:proteasome accessory factor C